MKKISALMCVIFTIVSLYYTLANFMNARLLLGIFWWCALVCWLVVDGIKIWRKTRWQCMKRIWK
jgi:endonuclease/exonuclease/phosphatase (EEP) superfamily protein YafD